MDTAVRLYCGPRQQHDTPGCAISERERIRGAGASRFDPSTLTATSTAHGTSGQVAREDPLARGTYPLGDGAGHQC
jgi:hypothetical protein